jgi:threonine dehydrogenase-like Zn-dependent dehydrogenase
MESHLTLKHFDTLVDRAKQMIMVQSDRPHVLREMIYVCQPGGILSIPGVYSGLSDMIPMGIAMNKGLTFRMGQTHVKRWTDELLKYIESGLLDPSFVVTHDVALESGPEMYTVFRNKQDSCIKVVLRP